jgi:hypothetical protein
MPNGKPPQQELIDKADARFSASSPLNADEKEVLKAAVEGRWARFPLGAGGKPSVTIRGELVRWLCADGAAKASVACFGIAIEGAKITAAGKDESGKDVLSFSSVVISFPLQFKKCTLPTRVWMFGMETTFLSFQESSLENLEADVLRVKGDFYLRGVHSLGVVRFPGATIGGDLDCSEGVFKNEPPAPQPPAAAGAPAPEDFFAKDYREQNRGMALNGQGITVGGDVVLKMFTAKGQVCLEGADIRGDLNCEGAQLANPRSATEPKSGVTLLMDRANVKGSVLLTKRKEQPEQAFCSNGEVQMIGTQVGDQLVCEGGEFINRPIAGVKDSGDAISADGMNVKGPVFLRRGFNANGNVRLIGATMARLDCREGTFTSLNLSSATIAGRLILFRMGAIASTKLDLSDLTVGTIRDSYDPQHDEADAANVAPAWPDKEHGQLILNGFTYGRWFNGITAARGIRWLQIQNSFTRQPYRQLAKILQGDGDNAGARRVLYVMEQEKSGKEGPIRKIWSFILWIAVGYGYYPWVAFLWLALFFGAGLGLYWNAYNAGYIAPTEAKTYQDLKTSGIVPANYERFHASAYSLENSLPVIKLGLTDHWQIDPEAGGYGWTAGARATAPPWPGVTPRRLRVFRWLHICAAWFFGVMGAAALSGLVRKE